jgi:L-ribulose-5-phosphate 3-epimerase UlaE
MCVVYCGCVKDICFEVGNPEGSTFDIDECLVRICFECDVLDPFLCEMWSNKVNGRISAIFISKRRST